MVSVTQKLPSRKLGIWGKIIAETSLLHREKKKKDNSKEELSEIKCLVKELLINALGIDIWMEAILGDSLVCE